MARSHYETLGVVKCATAIEIRSAYQELVKALHPDKHGGTAEANARFAEVTGAYAVLRDARKRKTYDTAFYLTRMPCRECRGTGATSMQAGFTRKLRTKCAACNGSGAINEEQ